MSYSYNGKPLPEELRFINPYLQRATELQSREPVISYYCKYYALQQAIGKAKDPSSKELIKNILDELENEKKTLKQTSEALNNDITAYAYVEDFALRVFGNADNEDQNGAASKKTAKTFLAAAIFLEILSMFNQPEDQEVLDKIKYAKWKALDIMQAFKEGRVPQPGGIASNEQATSAFPQPPSTFPQQHEEPQAKPQILPQSASSANNPPRVPPKISHNPQPRNETSAPKVMKYAADDENLNVEKARARYSVVSTAEKHTRMALSALQFDDTTTAVKFLQSALQTLAHVHDQ